MPRRHEDWLRQAEKDLRHAESALKAGDYEWTCFAAQQAFEKALKALYLSIGGEGWGHSLTKLLRELPDEYRASGSEMQAAMNLDKHYIPARYPNGFDIGAPMDYYSEENAREALKDAKIIFSFVRSKVSR